MDIDELGDRVASREELVAFLQELATDSKANSSSWENATLENFLEALAAWTEVADRYYANRGESIAEVSPWRVIAEALLAARIYE
jgi:hypothetical protein